MKVFKNKVGSEHKFLIKIWIQQYVHISFAGNFFMKFHVDILFLKRKKLIRVHRKIIEKRKDADGDWRYFSFNF